MAVPAGFRRWDRPLVAGLIALAGAVCFVLARLFLAVGGNITEFVQAARPYSRPGQVPRGLMVFPGTGYDGQFYYRLALDPANLHRTAFGITMDAPYRLQRIGYPALAWLASLGRAAWVPAALAAVNVLALAAIGLIGGMLARDAGRHALWGLLLAGYFGFFISAGCDLAEPVAAACLLCGILGYRRGRPVLAGLAFGYGALTRETVLIAPLALAAARLIELWRGRARPGPGDLAWCLPLAVFAAWQVVLWAATGEFVLAASVGGNSSGGVPFGAFAVAVRMNLGLLTTGTGAAYIWFAEVATLVAFAVAALAALRRAAVPPYERAAFVAYLAVLGALSADIWAGHADLRSIDEVYLLAVLILLASRPAKTPSRSRGVPAEVRHRRLLRALVLCAGLAAVVAATHQALYVPAAVAGHVARASGPLPAHHGLRATPQKCITSVTPPRSAGSGRHRGHDTTPGGMSSVPSKNRSSSAWERKHIGAAPLEFQNLSATAAGSASNSVVGCEIEM
jgi:hypothetical protein